MFCGEKRRILRKGIAAFLLLMMMGSGTAFAAENEENNRSNDGEETEVTETTVETVGEVNVKADEDTEDAAGDVVMFAGSGFPEKMKVKLTFDHAIKYENNCTHDFKVKYDGESYVSYCIEPGTHQIKYGESTAVKYDSALMKKCLYYSYGNPGYKKKTKAYLDGLSLKECYSSARGRYAFCHVMLSYIYDNCKSGGDAFDGVCKSTRTAVKTFVKAIRSWDTPIYEADISINPESVQAEWDETDNCQKTPDLKVEGTEGNSIEVAVPDGATMVKGETVIPSGSETVTVGESFHFTAPDSVNGEYTSPLMTGSEVSFQPYIIKSNNKQDMLYSVTTPNTTSFRITWTDAPAVTSEPEEEETTEETPKTEEPVTETEEPKEEETTTETETPAVQSETPEAAEEETATADVTETAEKTDDAEETATAEDTSPGTGEDLQLILVLIAAAVTVLSGAIAIVRKN